MATGSLTNDLAKLALKTPLPFEPPGSTTFSEQLDTVPLLLFRVGDDLSEGSTDSRSAKSKAVIRSDDEISGVDIFKRADKDAVAYMVWTHLNCPYENDRDNLVSWTASLLCALKYIFYRHNRYRVSLDEIRLFVVDTGHFAHGTFIRDMALMEAYSDYDEELAGFRRFRAKGTHYFGEYLSQGELILEDRCAVVTAIQLIEAGLFTAFPDLLQLQYSTSWAKDVIDLRSLYAQDAASRRPTTVAEFAALRAMADLFRKPYKALMGIWFFALRAKKDPVSAVLVWSRTQDFEDSLTVHLSTSRYLDNLLRMAEFSQFSMIAEAVQRHYNTREISGVLIRATAELNQIATQMYVSHWSCSPHSDAVSAKLKQITTQVEDMITTLRATSLELMNAPVGLDHLLVGTSPRQFGAPYMFDEPITSTVRRPISPSNSIRYPAASPESAEKGQAFDASERTDETRW